MLEIDSEIAKWIREVHASLAPSAVERSGAAWGPVTVRHRTTRPDWFGVFDDAWADPITPPETPTFDIVSASLDDIPDGISPPRITRSSLGTHGEVTQLASTGIRMTWNEHGGEIAAWDPTTAAAVLLRAWSPPWYAEVSPFRWFVHWGVVAAGGVLLHAACVGRPDGRRTNGVVLLGGAGYGKSTTALGCITEGWVTCGDDSVAVFPAPDGWHASPVYAAIKTRLGEGGPGRPDSTGITSPAAVTWDVNDDKRVHLLSTTNQPTIAARIDLDALVLLSPGEPPDAPWERVGDSTVRTSVAPSTAMALPFDRKVILERIGRLASELPDYRLPRRSSVAESVADVGRIVADAQPRISVIVPVFDGERYIAEALASIVGQSVGRFQIIVVDDASPDDAVAVVETLRRDIETAGHRLDVVRLESNQGIAGARNAGLARAEADLIAFLDQDDTWPAERTAVLLAAMRRTGCAVAQGHMEMVDMMPELPRRWVRADWFEDQHAGTVMGAILCRSTVFNQVGPLNPQFRTGYDDVDWFSRLRDVGITLTLVPQVVLTRRVHDRNQSRRAASNQADVLSIVRGHLTRTADHGSGTR